MLHTDCTFFSLCFFFPFFSEHRDEKTINVIKVYLFTFIHITGLNSHAQTTDNKLLKYCTHWTLAKRRTRPSVDMTPRSCSKFWIRVMLNEHQPSLKKKKKYLPIFSVYNPKKPNQVRIAFDSSAQFNGVSLNDVLRSGSNLINSLLGVFMRFWNENIGIMADIQLICHCFKVKVDIGTTCDFFGMKSLTISHKKDLVGYRMCIHVFGNSQSHAVGIYGLRRPAHNAEFSFGRDVFRLCRTQLLRGCWSCLVIVSGKSGKFDENTAS